MFIVNKYGAPCNVDQTFSFTTGADPDHAGYYEVQSYNNDNTLIAQFTLDAPMTEDAANALGNDIGDDRDRKSRIAVKVLVTGGAGFIGSYTCHELLAQGHDVVVLDRFRGPSDWRIMLGDIRDATAVTEAVAHAEAVIHLAGVLGTQETVNNPSPAAETNVLGGLNVLNACAQYRLPLVNIAVGNYFENNTYSITKNTVERFVRMNSVHRGLPQISVRALNAYGPKQSVSAPYGSSKVRKIMPSFIARALHGDTIQVYGDGQQIMDMIWVGDVAKTLAAALTYVDEEAGPLDTVFEAGSGKRTTVLEIARLVQSEVRAQTGMETDIEHLPMRPGETPGVEVRGDPATLAPLGVKPDEFIRLDEGVHRTVSYYKVAFHK